MLPARSSSRWRLHAFCLGLLGLVVHDVGRAHSVPKQKFLVSYRQALPAWLLQELEAESYVMDTYASSRSAQLDHGKRATNWLRLRNATTGEVLDIKPRCFSELALLWLWDYARRSDLDLGEGRSVDDIVGGEWWYQVRRPQAGISFHYDKDEGLASTEMRMRHPLFSTVTYLRGSGGPTLVFNQTTVEGNRDVPLVPEQGYLVHPQPGRHVVFRGDTQHGVLGSLSSSSEEEAAALDRITFLVNWWADPEPRRPYTDTVRSGTLKKMGLLKTEAVRRAVGEQQGRVAGQEAEDVEDVEVMGGLGEGEVVRRRIEVPPGDVLIIDIPQPIASSRGGLFNVTWDAASLQGGFGMLDLQRPAQLSALFAEEETKLLLFYRTDREEEGLLAFVPRLARRFLGRIKVYLCREDRWGRQAGSNGRPSA